MKMTANRIEVTTYLSVYTDDSISNGERDRVDQDERWVFNNLEDAAEYIASEINYKGYSAYDSGTDFMSMHTEFSMNFRTGEQEEYSMYTHFGKNIDCYDVRNKVEALIYDCLVNQHQFNDQQASRVIGYRQKASAVSGQSYQGTEPGFCGATHPDSRPRLYLVK